MKWADCKLCQSNVFQFPCFGQTRADVQYLLCTLLSFSSQMANSKPFIFTAHPNQKKLSQSDGSSYFLPIELL